MEPESQWWGVNPTGGEAKEVLPTTNTTTSPSLKDLSIQWANQPAPSTVTAQSLSPEPLIQLPPTQQDSPQALQGTTAGTLSSFEKMMEQFVNPPKTELQQQSDDMRTRILEQLGALGGEEQRLMEREQEAGIPQMREKLGEISTQLQNLQMEAQQIPLEIQQESIGRGRTAAGIAPLQQARLRENAIRSLSLSAIGNTLTGQLAAAQDSVDRAIRMEFEPIRREIDFLQNAYQFIREDLSAEEKRRGDAMNLMLRERERLIASQEDERRQIFSMAQAAIQAGADLQTVERIQRAGTMEEAQRLIAESGVLRQEAQRQTQVVKLADGRTVLLDTQTGEVIRGFAGETAGDKILSIADAKALGVPFGTTEQQAIAMGITPGKTSPGENIGQILRGQTVLRDVDRALEQADRAGKVSGWLASQIDAQGEPLLRATMSPAFELQQHLESIKSNISIDQLQLMREASPTGGALGQVPVRQQQYLMSVLGSLKPTLKPEVLRENLNDVYNVYLDTMFGAPQELSQAVKDGRMTDEQANAYLQMRKETGFNEYNLPVAKSGGQVITNLVIAPDGTLYNITD
jgi:hypothetical protein